MNVSDIIEQACENATLGILDLVQPTLNTGNVVTTAEPVVTTVEQQTAANTLLVMSASVNSGATAAVTASCSGESHSSSSGAMVSSGRKRKSGVTVVRGEGEEIGESDSMADVFAVPDVPPLKRGKSKKQNVLVVPGAEVVVTPAKSTNGFQSKKQQPPPPQQQETGSTSSKSSVAAEKRSKRSAPVASFLFEVLVKSLASHCKCVNTLTQKVSDGCFNSNIFKKSKEVHAEFDRYKCDLHVLLGDMSQSVILHTEAVNRLQQFLLASPFPIPLHLFTPEMLLNAHRVTVQNRSWLGAEKDTVYAVEEIEDMLEKQRAEKERKMIVSLVNGLKLYTAISPFKRHYGRESQEYELKLMMHCTMYRACTKESITLEYFKQKMQLLSQVSQQTDNGLSFETLHNLLSDEVVRAMQSSNAASDKTPVEVVRRIHALFNQHSLLNEIEEEDDDDEEEEEEEDQQQ